MTTYRCLFAVNTSKDSEKELVKLLTLGIFRRLIC